MALTTSTGWLAVESGQTTTVVINQPHVVAARLRWRGSSTTETDSSTNSASGNSVSFPRVPDGWQRSHGRASYAITVRTGDIAAAGTIWVSAPGGYNSRTWSVPARTEQRFSVTTTCDGTGTATGDETLDYGPQVGFYSPSISATVFYSRPIHTGSLRATVNGVEIVGPSRLESGAVSDWYNVVLQPGINTIAHVIGGSGRAYIEVEYTYQPYAIPPTRLYPQSGMVGDAPDIVLGMTLDAAEGSDATKLHAVVRLSRFAHMADPTIYDTAVSQVGWEYRSGEDWLPFPADGVPPGTEVRLTIPASLGTWYWDAASRDDWSQSPYHPTPWVYRQVLSVDALDGYSCAIRDKLYKCLSLKVIESANGELSTIQFSVPNINGQAHREINYGDPVYLSVYDSTGAEKQYMGRVWKKQPDDVVLHIVATMGDKILADRLVTSDHMGEDIGDAFTAIVQQDCSPLQSAIPRPFGIIVNLESKDRTALDVFQEVFRTWNLMFWTATEATDWVQYLADPATFAPQGIIVEFPMEEG